MVEIIDKKVEIPKICVFEFDNKRKRMSVILQTTDNKGKKTHKLYTKGADSAILSRLHSGQQPFLSQVQSQLDICCKQGLRTLCMSMRVFSEREMNDIQKKYIEISKSMDKEKLLEGFLDDIEKDMTLLGCSAVEDRLQDEVPETIAKLLEASKIRINRYKGMDVDW